MKFAVLGSGSSGNAYLVEAGEALLLIDAGFSRRELGRRLTLLGRSLDQVTARVTDAGGVLCDERRFHVGLRTIEIDRTRLAVGSRFCFRVNGQEQPKIKKDETFLFQPEIIVEGSMYSGSFSRRKLRSSLTVGGGACLGTK